MPTPTITATTPTAAGELLRRPASNSGGRAVLFRLVNAR
jgi:hypothetical protein